MKVDPFVRVGEAPPQTLAAFLRWALSGSWGC